MMSKKTSKSTKNSSFESRAKRHQGGDAYSQVRVIKPAPKK